MLTDCSAMHAAASPPGTWLRSGRYRLLQPRLADPAARAQVVQIDAAAMTWTDASGCTAALRAVCDGLYQTDDFSVALSVHGVGAVLGNGGGCQPYGIGILFPEQTHALDALTGNWNALGFERADSEAAYALACGSCHVDASGTLRTRWLCGDDDNGNDAAAQRRFTAARSGGFDAVDDDGSLYLYRCPNGSLMALYTDALGNMRVLSRTPWRPAPLPGSETWGWTVDSGVSGWGGNAFRPVAWAVAEAGSRAWTRQSLLAAGARETLSMDAPLPGFWSRCAKRPPVDGAALQELQILPIHGVGLHFHGRASTPEREGVFGVTVVTRQ